MRTRRDDNANYKAVFFNGKTLRMRLDPTREITVPKTPEIEDVAINSQCFANCSYCYTSATKHGKNFMAIVDKANDVWGNLKPNERPFQIAIGGAGESTIHPDWVEFVKNVNALGIVPNYTTNGMHLSDAVLKVTEELCGGVAVSYHPHIPKVFSSAIKSLSDINTRLNTHIIIGSEQSLNGDAMEIYELYKDSIEYFVMLPYQAAGRGKHIDTNEVWKQMFTWIDSLPKERQKQFAFGALFYPFLCENEIVLNIDKYEPEIYSGYRLMDDSYKLLRKSSYNLEAKY